MAGWTARDVVGHLVGWLPELLSSGAGVQLPSGPSAATDPAAAWRAHSAGVQALLDEPGDRVLSNPHLGTLPVDEAIDRFYTTDVFLHTWDLGTALGMPVTLDERTCAELLAGMEPLEELLRGSGQYGPRVPVPGDASAQDRLVGFIGRDPRWTPPGR